MIKIFHGSDRVKIAAEVKKILGDDYEVFDGDELKNEDIVNIFKGASLFAEKRKILLKDLTEKRKAAGEDGSASKGSSAEEGKFAGNGGSAGDKNLADAEQKGRDFYEEIAKYADTEHDIVIWETTLSQKKTYKDFVEKNKIEVRKIDQAKPVDSRTVFGIFDIALTDGERAVAQLEKIEEGQDPYRFFGLLASQAIKRYDYRNGDRERRILKELAKIDIQLKSTTLEPWILIKSFLIRMPKI